MEGFKEAFSKPIKSIESFEGTLVSAVLGPRRVGKTTLVEHYIDNPPSKKMGAIQHG